jgi:hypothetical protein
MSFLAVTGFPTLLGVGDTAVVGWLLPASHLVFAAIGVGLAGRLLTHRPDAYARLGTTPTTTIPGGRR